MRSQKQSLLLFFLYNALLNLPSLLAARLFGIVLNGWFALDYIILGLLSLFPPRFVIAALIFLALIADTIHGICFTYSLTPQELLQSLPYILDFPLSRTCAITIAILLALIVAWIISRITIRLRTNVDRRTIFLISASFFFLITSFDYLNGQLPRQKIDLRRQSVRLERFALEGVVIQIMEARRLQSLISESSNSTTRSASQIVLDKLSKKEKPVESVTAQPDIVLVLLESWGKPNDASLSQALSHLYTSATIAEHYDILEGSVPFSGVTLSGETRELCNNKLGFGVMSDTSGLTQCLPLRLTQDGYRTIAVHGFNSHMFRRNQWYPKLGFQELWFRDSLDKMGLQECPGAFPGICDSDIAQWIGAGLKTPYPNPRFYYWVTLNSHFPLVVPNWIKDQPPCPVDSHISGQKALCSWYELVFNVHRSVAKLAVQSLARPTIFVVVGDHMPPFSNGYLREQFSQDSVPYITLIPHSINLSERAVDPTAPPQR